MKEHEFLRMMEVQTGIQQALSHIAQGFAVATAHLGTLVAQGEAAMQDSIEVRGDDGTVLMRLPSHVGDPGPAASGWVQVMASDGNPISPTVGSSFKLEEEGLLLVCMTQEAYNFIEDKGILRP